MDSKINKLEDITSKEFLDKALQNAKNWCQKNLSKHLHGFQNRFNYEIFHYLIDDELLGYDMYFNEEEKGLIRVSTNQLKWHKERELSLEMQFPETDPESMFIHEITEFILYKTPEVFLHYFSKMEFPHSVALQIENINRRERGLKDWPEY